jgi:prevent-host-death family protein
MGKRVGTVEARRSFSRLISQAGFQGEHIIIERNGTPMAVLIGVDEYEKLVAAQAHEREARFERLLSVAERNQDVPPEQVEADVAEAVTAVREGK